MTREDPLRRFPAKYTWPARIGLVFSVVGLLADALALYAFLSTRNAGAMASVGAGYVALVMILVGVVSCIVGALIASGGRRVWRGQGERRVAFLCVCGMVIGPLAGFAWLFST